MESNRKKIAIFGAGSWGTAVAQYLAKMGHDVTLVPRRAEHAEQLSSERENRAYLPGFPLETSIHIRTDFKEALENTEIVFCACPSKGLPELAAKLAQHLTSTTECVLSLCKGLDRKTFKRPTELLKDHLGDIPVGTFSGPTYASEVARGQPSAVSLAIDGLDEAALQNIQAALSNEQMRVYTTGDLPGVEFASCLKNVYAIGAGICDGLNLGDNAKAAYLTRALAELVRLGTALGGQETTFYGLSGFGDLVATCSGAWSRNRTFGENIATGADAQTVIDRQPTVVEGYWATGCFHDLLSQKSLYAPILEEVHAVLYKNKASQLALEDLMARDLKAE